MYKNYNIIVMETIRSKVQIYMKVHHKVVSIRELAYIEAHYIIAFYRTLKIAAGIIKKEQVRIYNLLHSSILYI